jgi:hypothetical protein
MGMIRKSPGSEEENIESGPPFARELPFSNFFPSGFIPVISNISSNTMIVILTRIRVKSPCEHVTPINVTRDVHVCLEMGKME